MMIKLNSLVDSPLETSIRWPLPHCYASTWDDEGASPLITRELDFWFRSRSLPSVADRE